MPAVVVTHGQKGARAYSAEAGKPDRDRKPVPACDPQVAVNQLPGVGFFRACEVAGPSGRLPERQFDEPAGDLGGVDRLYTHPARNRLTYDRFDLLTYFTRPDAYLPILEQWADIPICLAHFGGAGDWDEYIRQPWKPETDPLRINWLGRILELLRSERYNLWTDISYTLFADDDFVYLSKVLLRDERVHRRVMFGSDFYVVENAKLEERRRALRIRAVLDEDVFREIAEVNPATFLGARRKPAFS